MTSSIRSHLLASVTGGLVVAGCLLAVGVLDKRTTQPVIYETLEAGGPLAGHGDGLSAHDIYMRDAPGVVFVKAATTGQWFNEFGASSSQRESGSSTGSGFLIELAGGSGLILTTYDVIEGADPLTGVAVQFDADGLRPAIVVGADQSDDLALLRVSMAGLPGIRALALGDSSAARVGDPTLGIADPFGSDRTLTSGIVSALQSQIQAPDGFAIDNVIETDTPALPGESGAPLLNASGRVIGINSQMPVDGDADADADAEASRQIEIPFAVPIDTVDQFLAGAGDARRATVGFLGVSSTASATVDVSSKRSSVASTARAGGVPVVVQPGSPAARAGLRSHDAIEAIDGQSVHAISDLDAIVTTRKPGATVSVTVRRGHRLRLVRIVLGSQTAPRRRFYDAPVRTSP